MKLKEIKKSIEDISKIKEVQAIYLFGSRARNEEKENSDVDICIIGNLNDKEKSKIFYQFSDNVDLSFFNELPLIIQIRIFKEGKPLFIKNEKEVELIMWKTLSKYREIFPLIKRRMEEMFEYVR